MGRRDRPVDRVRAAMRRLSRDRWLAPDECVNISMRLAECCSGQPSWTAQSAVWGACIAIGMLRGTAPAMPWDSDYGRFVAALHGLKRDDRAKAELLILKLQLERMTKWKQTNSLPSATCAG